MAARPVSPPLKRCAMSLCLAAVLGLGALFCAPAQADRRAVLGQIDLPHNYYFRELYLPQLTSGPSSVSFMPDGRSLVYSMQGSLWRQSLGSSTAVQLTAGLGYDYQPDVSPDGRRIVYVRYADDAMELQVLDMATGVTQALTHNGAVNTEPRWSPDGQRIAWVSTAGTGHLHIFVGQLSGSKARAASNADEISLVGHSLWPERKSQVARYYYSAFDHEISPSWAPDGKSLFFVSNPETVYGTGSIWQRALTSNAEPLLVQQEETTWKARPDVSPDGHRIVYASYAGRNWHQLWVTTTAGKGAPLALSYGDFDATAARWSRDAQQIAYLSNAHGDLEIHVLAVPGGSDQVLRIQERQYRNPMGTLDLHIAGVEGTNIPARVSVIGSDGRAYAPNEAWIHSDDGFDRASAHFETHYFHTRGEAHLALPPGLAKITVWHGLATAIATHEVMIATQGVTDLSMELVPLALPEYWRNHWRSADVHVHMNYTGTYRNDSNKLVAQAEAEDLDLVFNLIVNKEQRVPDISSFTAAPDSASNPRVVLSQSQEFHTSYWGHLGLLGLNDHVLLPGYAAYPNTAAASLYPTNASIADLAHAQSALVGYVHPFDQVPDPAHDAVLTNELPVDAALGKVDYYEVVGFSDHRASAEVWHRLLNCGMRLSAAAGTDAMADYASLRGPIGLNRTYVQDSTTRASDPADRLAHWLAALKAGRSMVTNSALLGLTLNGQSPGSEVSTGLHGGNVHLQGFMRSIVPMDHLEVLKDGKVLHDIQLHGDRRSADIDEWVQIKEPGWVLLQAWSEHANPTIFDIYPFATTNPVFTVRAADKSGSVNSTIHCGADADYFLQWIDRLDKGARAHPGFNSDDERQLTLRDLAAAHKVFEKRR